MMVKTKQRHSHHYSILATDVCLFCTKYKNVVKPGMETDRIATIKPAPGGVEVPQRHVKIREQV